MTSEAGSRVSWDYTAHASHYDKRADYSPGMVGDLLAATGCNSSYLIAELGAGTGKLTKELLAHGLEVYAVEPNAAMRAIGIKNTTGMSVHWSDGTGEATGLPNRGFHAAFFGSSFNVVDQRLALSEAARILRPHGWFACMWNHRDLTDPIQRHIESIIKRYIPSYSYGARRENPTAVIRDCGYFSPARSLERNFVWQMARSDITDAWRSHATLRRQSGNDAIFSKIVSEIDRYLSGLPTSIPVPYTSRAYFAQLQ